MMHSDPNPPRQELEVSGESFAEMLKTVLPHLSTHLDSLPEQPTWSTENFQEVLSSFDLSVGESEQSLEEIVSFLFQSAIPCTFNTASPGYLAYIPGGGLPQSGIADLISTVTNRYVGVWAAAPVLANIEQEVIRWFCDLFGWPRNSGGILTSGGSLANWTALVAARIARLGEEFLDGVVYCSDQAHHCIAKAARLCGIRSSHLRRIPTDHRFRMDPLELERAIRTDRECGRRPFFVVANGGSTNSGAVDPLPEIRKVCSEQEVWFHVDAAYGGFFYLTERGKEVLSGIETADSIVIDPHKGMFLPYGTGALLVRDSQWLADAFRVDADYLPDSQDEVDKTDFHEISPELSRDFRGLRIWLPLKMHGVRAFREQLDEKLDLTHWIHQQLKGIPLEGCKLEMVAEPQLSLLAFRIVGAGDEAREEAREEAWNRELLSRINAHRRIYLTSTRLKGKFVIRICVLSFRTHLDRMRECLEIVSSEIRSLVSRRAESNG